MRSSKLLKGMALMLLSATGLAAVAFAEPPNSQFGNKYVFVTGSMIPQKVKVKSVGTATVSPVSVYERRQIDRTGRFTAEGVLSALDPSVNVVSRTAGSR